MNIIFKKFTLHPFGKNESSYDKDVRKQYITNEKI